MNCQTCKYSFTDDSVNYWECQCETFPNSLTDDEIDTTIDKVSAGEIADCPFHLEGKGTYYPYIRHGFNRF